MDFFVLLSTFLQLSLIIDDEKDDFEVIELWKNVRSGWKSYVVYDSCQ